MSQKRRTGGCECGGITYEVRGELRDVVYCHCGQCRRTHGHYIGYTNAKWDQVTLTQDKGLTWYASSDFARRGFCKTCGGSLFWERTGSGTLSIAAGTFDAPSGLKSVMHIFTKDKGDYYEIKDGLECLERN